MIFYPSVTLDHIYPKCFVPLAFEVYENGKCIGDIKVRLYKYTNTNQMLNDTQEANKYIGAAAEVLALDTRFKADLVEEVGKTPIVAYIERFFIYPEYRGHGYGEKCLSELANNIKIITLTEPCAFMTFLEPNEAYTQNGETILLTHKEVKQMKKCMRHVFQKAGFIFPSTKHPFCGYCYR